MASRRARSLLATLLWLLAACQSAAPVRLAERRPAPASDDYQTVLGEHTRRAHIYDWLADQVDVHATYHGRGFKQAFAAARGDFHGRAVEEIERILAGRAPEQSPLAQFSEVVKPFAEETPSKPALATADSFFVAFYAADQSQRSLLGDDSIWDVSLSVDDGPALRPSKIEQLRRTPSLDQVYPYLDKLDISYLIYFHDAQGQAPIGSGTGAFTLRIVSKLADAQLVWQTLH